MPYQLDDGRLDRWSPDREKVWTTRWGMLRAALPDEKQQHSMLYAGSTEWRDYAIEFDVCGMRGVDKGVVVRVLDPARAQFFASQGLNVVCPTSSAITTVTDAVRATEGAVR